MASIIITWNANAVTDNVTDYEVWGANGTSVAFGSCTLLATVSALTWTDVGLAPGQARTYYVRAANGVGDSTPEGPLNITSAAASSVYVQNAGAAPSLEEGTHAGRPAAGNAGAVYVETDTKTIWRDNGATWDQLSAGGTPGGTSGQIQYNNSGALGGFTASGDFTINTATGAGTITSSVNLTGSPTTTTQAAGDSSTKIATDQFVATAITNAIAGVNPSVAVQAATTAAADTSSYVYNNGVSGIGATLTGPTANVAVTVDGFTFTALGQRLLVKNDTQSPSGAFNGIYYVTTLQAPLVKPILTRALDYDQPSDMNNTGAIPVVNGTVNANTSWLLTSTVNTVGTDPLTYVQFSVAPSNVLQTGGTNPTNHSLLLGKGTNIAGSLGAATNGQLPIGSTGADPVLGTITAGTGISVTNGAGTITVTNVGAGSVGAEVLISEVVTSSSQASVTFSSIPATWRNLRVIVNGRGDTAASTVNVLLQLNGDTGANYDYMYSQAPAGGSIQAVAATSAIIGNVSGSTAPANVASGTDAVIYNYIGTTFQKYIWQQSGVKAANTVANMFVETGAAWWRLTAAITSVKIFPSAGNFVDGSVVSLYGHY